MFALERVQLSVARSVLHVGRRDRPSKDILLRIGWPTLAWRRRRFQLLTLYELLNGEGSPCLRQRLPLTARSKSGHSFRNESSLAFPFGRSTLRLKSFLPSAVSLWNCLPSSVTSASLPSTFLKRLDAYFYSDKFPYGPPT